MRSLKSNKTHLDIIFKRYTTSPKKVKKAGKRMKKNKLK